MNSENLLKLQAYIDNELAPEESREVENWIARDQDARAICQELRETKALLTGHELPVTLPESREFYWTKIEREILRQSERPERRPLPWSARWWLRFALPFAGVALLIVLLLTLTNPGTATRGLAGSFHDIETPLEEASAITFHSQAAGMTVVWIDSGVR